MLRKPLHNIWSRNIFPVSMEDCGLYLPMWQEDMQSSPLLSYDPYHHSCAVQTALWGTDGRVLDGDDYINLDNVLTGALSATTVGTWIAWVRPTDATPSPQDDLICFADTSAVELISLTMPTASDVLLAQCYVAGALKWATDTDAAAFADATWACVGVVQDGTSPVLYVNGVAPAQAFSTDTDKTIWFSGCAGLDNGFIGARQINNGAIENYFIGRAGEVLLSTSAFSADEMLNFVEVTKWRYI